MAGSRIAATQFVHFTAQGGQDLRSESIKAFQRLWNQNHPDDQISADGQWGPQTEARLKRAPLDGFPGGVSCTDADEESSHDEDGDAHEEAPEEASEDADGL